MLLRLTKMIGILAIVPLLHIGYVILIGIADWYSPNVVFLYWLWMIGEIVFLPYALQHGYYPTQSEIKHMQPPDYLMGGLFLILFWIISALIIVWLLRLFRPYPKVRLALVIIPIVCSFILAMIVRIQATPPPLPDTVMIEIDATQSIREFPTHHRGFSQGGEGQMMLDGYFEQAMGIMREIHPRYIRIDHLYDYYNVLSFDDDGNALYNFSELDRIVDAILEAGAQPLMSLSYAPPAINPDDVYAPPTDFDVWGDLVYETVRYYNIERDLDIKYWEVWNEPNLHFFDGTIADYLDLYHATAQAVKRADESAWVGGPAMASFTYGLPKFYRFNDESWITALIVYAQRNNLPLDFVSWHFYSQLPWTYRDKIATYDQWLSQMTPKPQLLLTEWNYVAGNSSAMDTGKSVAYLAQTLSIFAESNLDQAFYFEPIDGREDWFGRWGLIRADGLRKPSFYAYTLFNRLIGTQLLVESNHPNIGAVATQTNDTLVILFWNNTGTDESIQITVDGITQQILSGELYGVDEFYGNSYHTDGITDTFIDILTVQADVDSQLQLSLNIPTYGIRLIELSLR